MIRVAAVLLASFTPMLSGCGVVDAMNAYSEAIEAENHATRASVASMAPADQARVQQCSAAATGRIEALRLRGQGDTYMFTSADSILRSCVNNPYYFASIPEPAPAPTPNPRITCNSMPVGGGQVYTTCQ